MAKTTQKENAPKSDKIKSSLDQLFKAKKGKVKVSDKPKEEEKPKIVVKKPKVVADKKRKYMQDGLPIYSLEELNVGKGGDTAECPFDCNCCF
jgi:hypothetical protein